VTDLDEWLRPGAVLDEVALEVDDPAAGLVLRVAFAVAPDGRRAELAVTAGGTRAGHEAEEAGPPTANWDRMRIGGLEWRMVEVLRRWELSVEDPEAGLQAYLSFSGAGPCQPLADGYEQVGTVAGQLRLADRLFTVVDAPARRWHTWR
jgi:hypothetical protein